MRESYDVIGDCVLTQDGCPTQIFERYISLQDAQDRVNFLKERDSDCEIEIIRVREIGPQKAKRLSLSLAEKIFRITQACAEIKRNGVGESNDPSRPLYSYVKIEDVLAVVNPLLKRYKLILTGQVAREPITHVGKLGAITEVLVDWTLGNIENDYVTESRTWRVPGCGCDQSGKAVYKAITGSRKYAMVLIFNLQFGDEPEEVQSADGSKTGPAEV